MPVHLQPHELLGEAEVVEQRRRSPPERSTLAATGSGGGATVERRQRTAPSRATSAASEVRRMIGVGRHLDRELPARRQRRGPPGEHAADGRAPTAGWRWRAPGRGRRRDVHAPMSPSSNRTPARACGRGVGEHRRRVVDADHRQRPRAARRPAAVSSPVAAPEVDGAGERSVGRDQPDAGPRTAAPARRRTSGTAPDPSQQVAIPVSYLYLTCQCKPETSRSVCFKRSSAAFEADRSAG